MIRKFYNYMEGSGFQSNKEDEKKPLYGQEEFEKDVNKRLTPNKPLNVQKIGDGRIVFEGETYVNEKSKRVLSAEQFRQSQNPSPVYREPLFRWVKLEKGCEMPDYDEPVLWLQENGQMVVDMLDKDGNGHLFEPMFLEVNDEGTYLGNVVTHWIKLPNLPIGITDEKSAAHKNIGDEIIDDDYNNISQKGEQC